MEETGKTSCCHARHKANPRSQELQDNIIKRLNRAIGQLNGVKAMIEDNRYCGDVLTQIAAVESALQNLGYLILQEHLNTCVREQVLSGHDEVLSEALDLIKKLK